MSRCQISLLLVALVVAAPEARADDAKPMVIKNSLLFACTQHTPQYEGPKDLVHGSCSPRARLRVSGPIEAGSAFFIDLMPPGSKKTWATLQFGSVSELIAAGTSWGSEHNDWAKLEDEKASAQTGDYSFTVRMVNEASGTKAALYSGKFNVKKFKSSDPKLFCYYVDRDWELPIAYLGLGGRISGDDNGTLYLTVRMTVRGTETDSSTWEGYLFNNGKPIGSKTSGIGSNDDMTVLSAEASPFNWTQLGFRFYVGNSQKEEEDPLLLKKNPGDYEMKVLHNGKLARTLKFSVDKNGKLADNGIAKKINVGDVEERILVPIKIIGGDEGKIDANAWKTGTFYGNPIPGFVVP